MKAVPDFPMYYVTFSGKVCNRDAVCLCFYTDKAYPIIQTHTISPVLGLNPDI